MTDKEVIIEACQCLVDMLRDKDTFPMANRVAAERVIGAVQNVHGVTLENPWRT